MSASLETSGNEKTQELFSKLFSCIKALKAFENKYDKKLNLDKLFTLLQIPVKKRKIYVNLILRFQELFHTVLKEYEVKEIQQDGISYLKTRKADIKKEYSRSQTNHLKKLVPKEIVLSKSQIIFWNDIIYSFKNVRRGKGFNLVHDTSEICAKLKELRNKHPYLFFSNGNELVYPSKFGIELGSKINSYIKANRDFHQISLSGSKILIKK
jgi:hypothetical protein